MKEYPAGYALLDVYEGGIMRTFHRPVTDFTRTWVRTSAMEVGGFQPFVTRGSLFSRAFTTSFDGSSIVGAGPADSEGPKIKVNVARRRRLTHFVRKGLIVGVTVHGSRTPVTVALAGRIGSPSRSRPLLLAAGKRRGSGRVHLRSRGSARVRMQRRRRTIEAVVTVTAGGRTVRRSVTLTR